MAQPGCAVVRQDRARRDRSRRIHLGTRSQEKAHALHPQVQRATQVRAVGVLLPNSENYYSFNHYSPLDNAMPLKVSSPAWLSRPRAMKMQLRCTDELLIQATPSARRLYSLF